MDKYTVRHTAGNYAGKYWGEAPGEVVTHQCMAKWFTVEELVKHRGLASALRNNTAVIVEVTYD